jgi:hypothetical protein
LLAARESEEFRFQTVSVIDGKPLHLDGLAERVRAAIEKHEDGESLDSLSTSEGGQDSGRGGRADCLEERIRRARERVANWPS